MRKSHGEGKLERGVAGLKKGLEAARKQEKREKLSRQSQKLKTRRFKLEKAREARKAEHLKFIMDQAKKRAAERAAKEEERKKKSEEGKSKEINPEIISANDPAATATKKSLTNVARSVKQIAKVGINAYRNRNTNKPNQEPTQSTQKTAQQSSTPSPQPLGLPPAQSTPPQMTGAQKREAIKKGTYLGRSRVMEEYSCWREEFLYELSSLRQRTKKRKEEDKPIDLMKGDNNKRIKLNPNVMENHRYSQLNETTNGASIFAKATPLLKRRTTPLSDIHLAKQPGKKSAEKVTDEMRKLFLGDVDKFYSNYDLSGNASDDNNVDSNKAISSESLNIRSIALMNKQLKNNRGV